MTARFPCGHTVRTILCVGLVVLVADSRAQAPDSTARVNSAARDTTLIVFPADAGGRKVSGAPALTGVLSAEELLDDGPDVFNVSLGTPGQSAGAMFDGLPSWHAALAIDGRSLDDLVTGAPRYDLLPTEALGPIRELDARHGAPVGIETSARRFRLSVPVTEIRFIAGQQSVQHVSGTHAQTRLPPAFLRGRGETSRLTSSFHVASRAAATSALSHTHALGRVMLTRPDLAVEIGNYYVDNLVRPISTSVNRRTLRNETWARLAVPLFGARPIDATVSWTTQRSVATVAVVDTLRIHASRAALAVSQPIDLVGHGLSVRLDAMLDAAPGRGAELVGSPGSRIRVIGAVRDSVQLGAARLALEAGSWFQEPAFQPFIAARADAGAWFAGLRYATPPQGLALENGISGRIAGLGQTSNETVLLGEVGARIRTGPWDSSVRLVAHQRSYASLLVSLGDTAFAVVAPNGALRYVGATATGSWRQRASRGVYASASASAGGLANRSDSALHERQDEALPRAHGRAQLGIRGSAAGIWPVTMDGALTIRAWTPFSGSRIEPITGLLALQDPSLRADPQAGVAIGFDFEAALGSQAVLFLKYDNALGDVLGEPPSVVQSEPLPVRLLTFGIFWALLN